MRLVNTQPYRPALRNLGLKQQDGRGLWYAREQREGLVGFEEDGPLVVKCLPCADAKMWEKPGEHDLASK